MGTAVDVPWDDHLIYRCKLIAEMLYLLYGGIIWQIHEVDAPSQCAWHLSIIYLALLKEWLDLVHQVINRNVVELCDCFFYLSIGRKRYDGFSSVLSHLVFDQIDALDRSNDTKPIDDVLSLPTVGQACSDNLTWELRRWA